MSRCVSCDKNLNDFESTRKIVREDKTIYYPDLCNKCFSESDLASFSNVVERNDLRHNEDISNEEFDDCCIVCDED